MATTVLRNGNDRLRKGNKHRRSGLILPVATFLVRKPLKNTLPTGPNVQICYTQGGRRDFMLTDRYKVRPFSGKY